MIVENQWFETADCSLSLDPFEMVHGEPGLDAYVSTAAKKSVGKELYSSMVNAPKWIPFAAEAYHTSKNPSDYFLVPTIIMPSDLPNRNGAAFPLSELTKFQPSLGSIAYQGWKGKGVHVEHANTDPTKAIGVVADVTMRRLGDTDLWKVITLLAIDRTKNLPITGAILRGERKAYSMGAMVRGHSCSICGSVGMIRAGHKTRYDGLTCKTSHASMARDNTFRTFKADDGSTRLGYLNVIDITPIEVSSVAVPAYVSAESDYAHLMSFA